MKVGRVVSFAKLPFGAFFRFTTDDVVAAIKRGKANMAGNYFKVGEKIYVREHEQENSIVAKRGMRVEFLSEPANVR